MSSHRTDLLADADAPRSAEWSLTAPDAGRSAVRSRLVGFFPGLGSRAAYRDLDASLLNSGLAEVLRVYREAAEAVGDPEHAEKLLPTSANLPEGRLAKQSFIGIAFLVHGLALDAHLRASIAQRSGPLRFLAYTGESFGIITAAVASGALSIADGVRIAGAFTPLMLLAADGADRDEPVARRLAAYLPESVRAAPLVPEPFHVVALIGDPDDLGRAMAAISATYPKSDVEVHKFYARHQTNVYVRARAKPSFDLFMKNFAGVRTTELKPPTTFLAHSERMQQVRGALDHFMDDAGAVFEDPHTPVISNDGAGLLVTGPAIRHAILSITCRIMASRDTVERLADLDPDLVVELGHGGKSLALLRDNGIEIPAVAHTGPGGGSDPVVGAVALADRLKSEMQRLRAKSGPPGAQHHDLLRELFRISAESPGCSAFLDRVMTRAVRDEMLRPRKDRSTTFHRFLEVFQHTRRYGAHVDIAGGDLILQAQSKKIIDGTNETIGRAYTELKVLDGSSSTVRRVPVDAGDPEVVVFHFDQMAELRLAELSRNMRQLMDTDPVARWLHDETVSRLELKDETARAPFAGSPIRSVEAVAATHIVYQYALFDSLRRHRPAIFAPCDHCLEGSDLMGWLTALAASGSCSLADAVMLYASYLRGEMDTPADTDRVLKRPLSALRRADVPIISPDGTPLQSKKDIEIATRRVVAGELALPAPRRINLNGDCHVISLGSAVAPHSIDCAPYHVDVIAIRSPDDVLRRDVNSSLDAFEDRCLSSLTGDNERVLRFARDRRLLSSTVYAYVKLGERIAGFGKGGSESMTMFLTMEDGDAGQDFRSQDPQRGPHGRQLEP